MKASSCKFNIYLIHNLTEWERQLLCNKCTIPFLATKKIYILNNCFFFFLCQITTPTTRSQTKKSVYYESNQMNYRTTNNTSIKSRTASFCVHSVNRYTIKIFNDKLLFKKKNQQNNNNLHFNKSSEILQDCSGSLVQ